MLWLKALCLSSFLTLSKLLSKGTSGSKHMANQKIAINLVSLELRRAWGSTTKTLTLWAGWAGQEGVCLMDLNVQFGMPPPGYLCHIFPIMNASFPYIALCYLDLCALWYAFCDFSTIFQINVRDKCQFFTETSKIRELRKKSFTLDLVPKCYKNILE